LTVLVVYLDVWTIDRRRRKMSATGNQTANTATTTNSPQTTQQQFQTMKSIVVEYPPIDPRNRITRQSRKLDYFDAIAKEIQ